LPKDALISPQGVILTLGEDRRGVLHGTTRSANALVQAAHRASGSKRSLFRPCSVGPQPATSWMIPQARSLP
jgi:hypothetical protein